MLTARFGRIVALFALVGLGAAGCGKKGADQAHKDPTGKKIALRMNYTQGQAFDFTMGMDMTMNIKAQGQKVKANMGMTMVMGMDVKDVSPDGIGTVDVTYRTIKFSVTGGPQTVSYDSTQGSKGDQLSRALGALIDKTLTLQLDPKGKVISVKGGDAIVQAMRDSGDAAMADQMKSQFSDEAMEQMFGQIAGALPPNPVDNGDSWNQSFNMSGQQPMKVDARYKLLDHGAGKSSIGVSGKMKSTGAAQGLSGDMYGTIDLDEQTGWPVKASMTMEFSGDVGPASMDAEGTMTMSTVKK